MKNVLAILLVLGIGISASAQKTVEGVCFSACINKPGLPSDFYKGKFLVLDLWATWCGPCIGSFPQVKAFEEKYQNNPNIIFATLSPESKGKVDTFYRDKKNKLPRGLHLVDNNGATWTYFDIHFIPDILVFSPAGKLVFEGRIEQLAEEMDGLLKGAVIVKIEKQPIPVTDEWARYKDNAAFIALTGPADSTDEESGGSSYSMEKATFRYQRKPLLEVVSSVGGVTTTKIKSNDSVKLGQRINLYYKQTKNSYREFDKGLFNVQYRNHMLHLLEQTYGFRTEWATDHTEAWKIVVKDAAILEKNATASTKGSYSSTIDDKLRKFNLVNQQLQTLAEYAEEELGIFVFADAQNGHGYDMMPEFSSRAAFEKSLTTYGLALERVPDYEVRKLSLIFE